MILKEYLYTAYNCIIVFFNRFPILTTTKQKTHPLNQFSCRNFFSSIMKSIIKSKFIHKIIYNNPHYIKFIPSPPESLQLLSIRRDVFLITHIKSPSIKIQLKAVAKSGWAIKYINTLHSSSNHHLIELYNIAMKNKYDNFEKQIFLTLSHKEIIDKIYTSCWGLPYKEYIEYSKQTKNKNNISPIPTLLIPNL